MARLLVLGANGQVGHELLRAETPAQLEIAGLTRSDLDVSDRDAFPRVLAERRPDIVVNAAAYTAVDKAESESERAIAVNRDAVGFLAEACREHNVPLLHISTDYVFDGTKDGPYREDDPVSPLGVYGRSKLEGEERLRATLDRHVILRTAWVFGAHGHNFVKTMLRLADTRDELSVVDDQRGCPTSAADIAAALLEVAAQASSGSAVPWGTYHFASAGPTTWHGFATEIFRQREALTGKRAPKVNAITTADYPTPAQRPANSVLACDKIREAFGIEQPNWRESVNSMMKETLA